MMNLITEDKPKETFDILITDRMGQVKGYYDADYMFNDTGDPKMLIITFNKTNVYFMLRNVIDIRITPHIEEDNYDNYDK